MKVCCFDMREKIEFWKFCPYCGKEIDEITIEDEEKENK